MLKRVITTIVALPLFIFVIWSGHFTGVLALLSIWALNEIHEAFGNKNRVLYAINGLASLVFFFVLRVPIGSDLTVFLFAYILINLIFMVFNHAKIKPTDVAINIFGFLYVTIMFSAIYLVRMAESGQYLVWLIFISAWGSDTCAYLVGVPLGKHKLPQKLRSLSPKKSIQGCVGGIIGAGVIAVGYAIIANRFFEISEVDVLMFGIIGVVGALFSQIGDLASSAIKRSVGIKDFGRIFPGHGGVIDRFDSILFTGPIVYIIIYYFVMG